MRKTKHSRRKLGRGQYGAALMRHFDLKNNNVEQRRDIHKQYVARIAARKAARASAK